LGNYSVMSGGAAQSQCISRFNEVNGKVIWKIGIISNRSQHDDNPLHLWKKIPVKTSKILSSQYSWDFYGCFQYKNYAFRGFPLPNPSLEY